ncbi:unnamed protein product [Gongylonema pulchrum]|uniref:Myosin motor domain-containing protein n=1 Tax=Gongylonema pulchrum TaxID=637853 RepID=A0A183DA25_9BILA|nr:unnamed protein product [Gongylonema pulchrum]
MDWPKDSDVIVVQQVNSEKIAEDSLHDLLNLTDKEPANLDYTVPISTVDLSKLDDDFFAGDLLTSANEYVITELHFACSQVLSGDNGFQKAILTFCISAIFSKLLDFQHRALVVSETMQHA